ncbi:MAG TPA: DUF420 domain-containing protein [Candidatus Limnocylindrales bacterium]|nr:DUF420 domain-containing protein [Candidatus Limnocylindrales bacterium]
MNLRASPGLFNANATPLADLTLLAYALLLVVMLLGFIFARQHKFAPHHKLAMTFITVVNWVLILFVMAVSYGSAVRPELPEGLAQPWVLLPTIHLITGALAQVIATYLLFRMWFENELPGWTKVRRIKPYMRLTLLLWLTTVVLGVAIYVVWYVPAAAAPASDAAGETLVTPEPDAPVATPELAEPAETPELSEPAETPEAGG